MTFQVSYTFLALNKFSATARRIKRDTVALTNKIKQQHAASMKATEGWRSFNRSVVDAGKKMTLFASLPIAFGFKKMIDMASDATETANKFAEVFKGIQNERGQAVAGLAKDFKLASSTSQELLSNTGDLLVGLGLNRKEALKLSEGVVRLSADVASFKNVQGGTERAAISLTKALLGEREMLKETFKTAVLEEEVKKRAVKIASKRRGLTEQQAKALATLAIVTERNKDAIGDFARTQDQYANQTRINQELTKEMAESFGKLLLPVAIKVRKSLISITEKINNLSPGVKKVILIILAVIAVVGPLLLILGALSSAFVGLTLAAGALGVTVSALLLPILAIGAGIAIIIAVVMNLDKLKKKFSEMSPKAKAALTIAFFPLIMAIKAMKTIWGLMSKLKPVFVEIASKVKDLFDKITSIPAISGILKKIGDFGGDMLFGSKIDVGGDISKTSQNETEINVNVKGEPGTVANAGARNKSGNANIGLNVLEAY